MSQQLMISGMQQSPTKRDPLLDHPAVKLHREVIHLRANHIQREYIAAEIPEEGRGLRIWEGVLIEWMGHGRNPKDVVGMLKAYRVVIDGMIGANR